MPKSFDTSSERHQVIEAGTSPAGHAFLDLKLDKKGRDAQHYSGLEHAPEAQYHDPDANKF